MKLHIISDKKKIILSYLVILLTILLILCSCHRRPTVTFYMGPSNIQDSADELEVQDGKYQEALERCQEKLKQVQPDSVEQADVFRAMGNVYAQYMDDGDNAKYYINKAIAIDQRNGRDIDLAKDYCAMSAIYTGTDVKEGLEYLDKAEQIYKKYNKDSLGLAEVLMDKGRLYQNAEQLDEALKVFKEAQAIYDKRNEQYDILCLLTGGIYLDQKEYKLAEEQYLRAQSICESKGDLYGIAVAQDQLGWLYSRMKEYDNAIESYNKALKFYKKDNAYQSDVARVCNNLADCYAELYMVDESTEAIIEANRLIRNIKPETGSRIEDEKLYKHNLGMYYKGVTGDISEEGFETWYTDVIIDGKDWKKSLEDEGKKIIVTSEDSENGS